MSRLYHVWFTVGDDPLVRLWTVRADDVGQAHALALKAISEEHHVKDPSIYVEPVKEMESR